VAIRSMKALYKCSPFTIYHLYNDKVRIKVVHINNINWFAFSLWSGL